MAFFNGTKKSEVLKGTDGNDILRGGDGDDTLFAGKGTDILFGGGGADDFVITSAAILQPSKPGDRTTPPNLFAYIYDFNREEGDKIDLSRIDIDLATPYRQGLFLGLTAKGEIASQFTRRAGEVIVQFTMGNYYIFGDVNGDGTADFSIQVKMAGEKRGALRVDDFLMVRANEISFVGETEGQKYQGTEESDIIYGGFGNDFLYGSAGNDLLIGGAGNDTVRGGVGADTMVADSGFDTLWGDIDGTKDIFQFTEASIKQNRAGSNLVAMITSFERGYDVIDFSTIDIDPKKTGRQGLFLSDNGKFNGKAGELVVSPAVLVRGSWMVTLSGDLDGKNGADFQIQVFMDKAGTLGINNFRF